MFNAGKPLAAVGVSIAMMMMNHFGVLAGCLVLWAVEAKVEASDGKFAGIAEKNVFRLSLPKPEEKPIVVQPELPQISLQGVTRILGLGQALLKIQAKTKSTTTGDSCILGEGQSRDGVVVLRIDVDSGTVWLTNHGVEQVLMIKQ